MRNIPIMSPLKKFISFTLLVFILSCNTSFASVASDFSNEAVSIDALIKNTLAQEIPLTLDEIIVQLKAVGATKEDIKNAEAAYTEQTTPAPIVYDAPKKSNRSYSYLPGGGVGISAN